MALCERNWFFFVSKDKIKWSPYPRPTFVFQKTHHLIHHRLLFCILLVDVLKKAPYFFARLFFPVGSRPLAITDLARGWRERRGVFHQWVLYLELRYSNKNRQRIIETPQDLDEWWWMRETSLSWFQSLHLAWGVMGPCCEFLVDPKNTMCR